MPMQEPTPLLCLKCLRSNLQHKDFHPFLQLLEERPELSLARVNFYGSLAQCLFSVPAIALVLLPGLGAVPCDRLREYIAQGLACLAGTSEPLSLLETGVLRSSGMPLGGGGGSNNSQTTPTTTSTAPIRHLLGAADVQTAHPATSSTAPTHQRRGSANAEPTPAGAPAAAADRKQRPDTTCGGKNG